MNRKIEAKPGKTSCPDCLAKFEIDDRIECIFVDTDNPRLPIRGMICNLCGLIQNEKNEICMYCGERLHTTIQ